MSYQFSRPIGMNFPKSQQYQPRPEHRERLRRFYEKVNPSKIPQIDEILESFAGEEDDMFKALEDKYRISTQLATTGVDVQRKNTPPPQQQLQQLQKNRPASPGAAATLPRSPTAAQTPQQNSSFNNNSHNNNSSVQVIPVQEHKVINVKLPDVDSVQHFSSESLPILLKSLSQVQEAYSKIAESIALANAKGVDVSRSAAWVVSAQLGASNFIANAKHFLDLAGDEERRMKDAHSQLSSAVNSVASANGTGNVRFEISKNNATSGNGNDATLNRSNNFNNNGGGGPSSDIFSPLQHQRSAKSRANNNRVVFDVNPVSGERHVVHDLIHAHAHSGDLIILHPGVYYENLVIRNDVEIRVASTVQTSAMTVLAGNDASSPSNLPDASRMDSMKQSANLPTNDPAHEVIFLPADPSMPTIQVVGEAKCIIQGIHFCKVDRHGNALIERGAEKYAENGPAHQDGVPHISTTGRSQTRVENCTFTSGGGGVVCVGTSCLVTSLCLFRGIAFAAIYAKDQTQVQMVDTRCSDCEVAIRVRDAKLSMLRCEVVRSAADGVILHAAAQSDMERVVISDSGANGILLSSAANCALTDCRLVSNGKWGLDAPRGAEFSVVRGMIVKNVNGPMSRQPTTLR